jgi:DNA repair exonuclease SbcCD nuclease subunit
VVIVHSSDIHVDDGDIEGTYGGDGTAGLRSVLAAARAAHADVALLAGDTFEHQRLPRDLVDRAARLLAEAGMPVVILPGNHDPIIPDSVYRRGVADPANVHVLGVTHEQAVLFPALGLEIWGHAHRDYGDMDPLGVALPRRTFWQIAAAHGHYEPMPNRATSLRPSWLIGDDEIAATGADYVALGHWNRAIQVGDGKIPAYYSGSPDLARTVNLIRLTEAGMVVVTRAPLDLGDLSPGR